MQSASPYIFRIHRIMGVRLYLASLLHNYDAETLTKEDKMRQTRLMLVIGAFLIFGLVSFAFAQMMGSKHAQTATTKDSGTMHSGMMGQGMMGGGMMGGGTMGMGSDSGTAAQSEAIKKILSEMRQSQNLGPSETIDLSKVTKAQLEKLGDAWMDIMIPNQRQHEMMDQMMGGEGSESLANAHRAMGSCYLSFLQNGTPSNMMMSGMMRMGTTGMTSNTNNMMDSMSENYSAMSTSFDNLESHLKSMMKINDLKTLKAELQKQYEMMQSMRNNMMQQQMWQNMTSFMNSSCTHGMMGMNPQGSQTEEPRSGNH